MDTSRNKTTLAMKAAALKECAYHEIGQGVNKQPLIKTKKRNQCSNAICLQEVQPLHDLQAKKKGTIHTIENLSFFPFQKNYQCT